MARQRCPWCEASTGERAYHDREWGVPVHDQRTLFEFLTLEGAQAGLSWRTVLRKREGYRRAFLDYELPALARLDEAALAQRMTDPGIVRNRLKVWSVRGNAVAALAAIERHGSLDAALWRFVEGTPVQNRWQRMDQVPAYTTLSDRMSRELKREGFRFVGSTICYAFMQAVGMVNDHLVGCFRHEPVRRLGLSPDG